MTRNNIEDYLYFLWAPLLKAGAVNADEIDGFRQMIILTLSQASVYIEAPAYKAGGSREFSAGIKSEIDQLTDKIFSDIPGRLTDDSYWLKITTSNFLPPGAEATNTQLQPEQSFGPFKIEEDKFISFNFYYLAHQLLLQLPLTPEISVVISTKKPVELADGPVTNIDIAACTIWLSSFHFDRNAIDTKLYIGVRLKKCSITFDNGYNKSGNRISAGLAARFAGFVITCIAEDEARAAVPGFTIADGNQVIYPQKFVFTAKLIPGLPQLNKIMLSHAEPFASTLFGDTVNTLSVDDIAGNWLADKQLLSFSLQSEHDTFTATTNVSPVFDLKGAGKIIDPAWYFSPVSISHTLAFGRLGIALESGYIGFDVKEDFTLAWNGLENSFIRLKQFFIRTSPETLFIFYTTNASLLAKQELKLWKADEKQKGRSTVHLNYKTGGAGNFFSHRTTDEQHTTSTGIIADLDRPLLTNGDPVFLQTTARLLLSHEKNGVTAVVLGEKMDPAIALENSAFRQLSSFALSNALILVNPVEIFFVIGRLNKNGVAITGQCQITFPVQHIEHTLPDPYITSLFNDQPANGDAQSKPRLKATVRWDEPGDTDLLLQLCDENGNVFTPKGTITDEQLADQLLRFPLPHPGERTYDDMLSQRFNPPGILESNVQPDDLSYGNYQAPYHSKTNTTGAFSTLHILPGNTSLVDVSGRASQMGIAFSRRLDNAENGILAVLENTGYTMTQTYRIDNNELVSSGRFVRAFTLPQVQWEPVIFEREGDRGHFFTEENPFPFHGVPTRMASANKSDVPLAPIPVSEYIVEGFRDVNGEYAAAAHFALPFGMNAVALFHPMVDNVVLPPRNRKSILRKPDPYSYTILNFNQPAFILKKTLLSGAIQIKALSEGYPKIPRANLPDPSFHGAVLQMPEGFEVTNIDPLLRQVIAGTQTATAVLPDFIINPPEHAGFVLLRNIGKVNGISKTLITYTSDSILGKAITEQFNIQMWGEQEIDTIQVDKVNRKAFLTFKFKRSPNAKVPLRRIDFSGLGASIFSNWLNKSAEGGAVSQVKFNILIGRVAHEVIQIKSCIIPFFIPVVRTLIIERKNHAKIIRTDTGWVATGPGEFHRGYRCHPGVLKGAYNVTSIKDTQVSIDQPVTDGIAKMAGVYFDADIRIENVVSGFKNTVESPADNYRFVASKKQFGYIIMGNPKEGSTLEAYFTPDNLLDFMSRPDVGPLGGPVDCVVNIAGSDQLMHLTRVDVTAATTANPAITPAFVAAGRGTLHLPKGGSWSVVKKILSGATLPLTGDETIPLIRNGVLDFNAGNPPVVHFNKSLHVLGNPVEIDKYATGSSTLANTEYALLQSTDTQKLLFPRPSFDSKSNAVINGITDGAKQIFITNPTIADPYSLLKSNTIFPDNSDALTLGAAPGVVNALNIVKGPAGISFPDDVAAKLTSFIPPECDVAVSRKLYLVQEKSFEIYIDYGSNTDQINQQHFSVALDGNADDHPGGAADPKKWAMGNTNVAIVVNLDVFRPLITVKGTFTAEAGKKPEFKDAELEWGGDDALQKIVQVLTILSQLSSLGETGDIIKNGFSFVMGNSPDSWSYKCTIEEKIPVIKFPTPVQLSQLPGPAPLIVEAGLNLGVFFNLSLSTDPNNLVKAGAGIMLGFEATIQVLILTIEVATAYGVGSARVDIFIELPDAKPTFKFTMGFGATVAVQLPVVGYVSITRVISLGASIDSQQMQMTVGQMLRGVITVAGGLASVSIQVEASGTVVNRGGEWTAVVRGVFSLDITVAWVLSWDFSEEFEHSIDLPNPF